MALKTLLNLDAFIGGGADNVETIEARDHHPSKSKAQVRISSSTSELPSFPRESRVVYTGKL